MTEPNDTAANDLGIDVQKPSVARVYDLALGGKDNFEVDRQAYAKLTELAPEIPQWARENREWLARVITWLVSEQGIDQFLDLGSGLPTAQNTHQVAHRFNSRASVAYVDNDPIVVRHGQALLVDNDRTDFAAADFTKPAEVFADRAVKERLDLSRPVALIEALMLHHIPDLEETRAIAAAYIDAVPSGSYVALSHVCNPRDGSEASQFTDALEARFHESWSTLTFRTPAEITSLLPGLDLIGPGLVPLYQWHAPGTDDSFNDEADRRPDASYILYAAVARKP